MLSQYWNVIIGIGILAIGIIEIIMFSQYWNVIIGIGILAIGIIEKIFGG